MAKSRWTADRGPRVHEVAFFLRFTSKEVRQDLAARGVVTTSAASRVPVREALAYCSQWRPACQYWRNDDEYGSTRMPRV